MSEANGGLKARHGGPGHLLSTSSAVTAGPGGMAPCVLNRSSMISASVLLLRDPRRCRPGPDNDPGRRCRFDHTVLNTSTDTDVHVDHRSDALPGRHVRRRRPHSLHRPGAVPAREDLGLRPDKASGCPTAAARNLPPAQCATTAPQTPEPRRPGTCPNVGFLLFDGDKGQIYFRLFTLRPLPESAEPRRDLRRCLRQHQDRARCARTSSCRSSSRRSPVGFSRRSSATTCMSGPRMRPRATRHRSSAPATSVTLQPVRQRRRRHHVAASRAQHRRPVPVLARRRRPPDRRRVLPRLVHDRRLAQGRAPHQG